MGYNKIYVNKNNHKKNKKNYIIILWGSNSAPYLQGSFPIYTSYQLTIF